VVSGAADGTADGVVASFAAGSRIAGYRLEERIGQGGMAVVFRARDEQLDRLVALKILAPALAGDVEFRRRFTSESRAAAAIDDPHIVPVFAAGEADGVLFIAMRYVAGGDALSLLNREGPLPPGRVVAIISPVASALDSAHRAGLVHRDVKPSNMLMDVLPGRPDHVYLSDFGLSKSVASTSGITMAGAVMGTLEYISPEQIGGRPVDGRADQYALACSAFELLAGAPPFRRDEPAAMMFAHLSEPPPQLTSSRAGLPPGVDLVMSRALAKVPGDRYASCGQFADALRDAFGFQPYRSGPQVMPAATRSPAEATWPPAGAATQHRGRAADGADTLSPVSGTGDAPATETSIPATTDAITAQPPEVGGSDRAQRPRRLRRRIAVVALIMAAAGLTAGLLSAGLRSGGGSASATAVPISVKSALSAVSGDVYVVYLGGVQASAEVYGEIRKAANGEVARLYAQQFPYQNAPTQVSSVVLHPAGSTARYGFQVTPTLATRYRVELFQSSTAPTPLATSGVATIYVAIFRTERSQACSRPICHESLQVIYVVPPSTLQTEMPKPSYLYFGVNLGTDIAPPVPQWLKLGAGHGHVTAPRRISADEFSYTVTFSFQIGNDAYHWAFNVCTKATEAEDGIGLPGHHGCGDEQIPGDERILGNSYLG
jgi:serine/threonine protein kinase